MTSTKWSQEVTEHSNALDLAPAVLDLRAEFGRATQER
jgi:hypothetical protein